MIEEWKFYGKYYETDGVPIQLWGPGMTLNDYQELSHKTSGDVEIGGRYEIYPLLGLAGEVGELLNKVKKYYRDGEANDSGIKGELGDILWYLAEFCSQSDFTLEEVAQYNLDKLKHRAEKGTIHGSGDER